MMQALTTYKHCKVNLDLLDFTVYKYVLPVYFKSEHCAMVHAANNNIINLEVPRCHQPEPYN